MKKLILKWMGLTDLKGRVEYCEALAKDNKKEIKLITDNYCRPLTDKVNINLERVVEIRAKIKTISQDVDQLKDTKQQIGGMVKTLCEITDNINDLNKVISDQQNQINTLCMQVDELNVEISKLKPKTTKPTTRVKPIVKTHDKSPKKSTKK
jgi:chromosome segregation ATPase